MPCVAVVENMSHFDADGNRYYPFGRGSGSEACINFKNLIKYLNDLSAGSECPTNTRLCAIICI